MDSEHGEIESADDYSESPQALAQRWGMEIAAAKENLKPFHDQGEKVIKEYLGEGSSTKRLNLFYADVQTKAASLSGEPKVRARRRHADAQDEVARVSADMLERLLNTDVERDSDGFRRALRNARGDWQKPALGQVRFRYVMEEGAAEEGAAPVKKFEDVETDYVHWKDFLWSKARTWDEVRWVAYRVEMNRDDLEDRFGEELGKQIPLSAKAGQDDDKSGDVWKRAEVWEIWDKEERQRLFYVEGFSKILEVTPDPLGLPNFFPSPEPLAANTTTSNFIPKSFYFLAEDLYEQAHDLTRRIRDLVAAIKVIGAYSSGNSGFKDVLDSACENEMIAVDNLAALLGQDGLSNAAWFMPIAPYVEALVRLVEQRNLVRSDIAEVLGLSDIMRGQQAARATATTDRIKARAFSMRSQVEQDEYARFATDAQKIRAHIISKQFDPETIIKRSNIEASMPELKSKNPEEAQKAQMLLAQAVQLLKDDIAAYVVDVDSDSLSMTDLDAVQQESMGALKAITDYVVGWAPLVQGGGPVVAKMSMEMLKVAVATFRGGERYEGIIDRAVSDMEHAAAQPKPPPPPDPKMVAAQAQAKAVGMKAQADMAKTGMDLQATTAEHGMRMKELAAETVQAQVENQGELIRAAVPRPVGGLV